MAPIWPARRGSALRCSLALRSTLVRAPRVPPSYARPTTLGRPGGTSSLVAARRRGVCVLAGGRSGRARRARRSRAGRRARFLRRSVRTRRRRRSSGSEISCTANGGRISLRRRHRRSSRASPGATPSRRTRRAGLRAACPCAGTGVVASWRFADQTVDRPSRRSLRGRCVGLCSDISAPSIVALAYCARIDADRSFGRRSAALVSRDRNHTSRSLRRRAPFVHRKINARELARSAGALRHHVLSCGRGADRGSHRSGAFRRRRRVVTRRRHRRRRRRKLTTRSARCRANSAAGRSVYLPVTTICAVRAARPECRWDLL